MAGADTRLAGKVAIVTGAGAGIGRAIACRLAEAGAAMVLGDIDGAGLEETIARIVAAGGRATGVVGDVTEEADADGLIDRAIAGLGQADILVNNVGGSGHGRIWDMSPAQWDAAMRHNLRPTFLCTRAVARHMIERRQGKIICISSGAKEGAPWLSNLVGAAAYATAKAGLIGFVRDMALQLGEHDVRINALAVGAVATERTTAYFQHLNDTYEFSPRKLVPLRRVAAPLEIANAALFLASDESSYVTGATINVNGGR